jgi:hypothetical protein
MFGILPLKINFVAGILSEKHDAKRKVKYILFWALELKSQERKYSTRSPNKRRY